MAASEQSKAILDDIRNRLDNLNYTEEARKRTDSNRAERFKAAGIGDFAAFLAETYDKAKPAKTESYHSWMAKTPERAKANIAATYAGIKEGTGNPNFDGGITPQYFARGEVVPGAETPRSQAINITTTSRPETFGELAKAAQIKPGSDRSITDEDFKKFVNKATSYGIGKLPTSAKEAEKALGINNLNTLDELKRFYYKLVEKPMQAASASEKNRLFATVGPEITKSDVEKMLAVQGQDRKQVQSFLDEYMRQKKGVVLKDAYAALGSQYQDRIYGPPTPFGMGGSRPML
jgi:hypothetical protein